MEQGRTEHACDARDAAKEITTQDYQVLRLMREMDYGHLVITVKGGQPVHAEVQKSVQIKWRTTKIQKSFTAVRPDYRKNRSPTKIPCGSISSVWIPLAFLL